MLLIEDQGEWLSISSLLNVTKEEILRSEDENREPYVDRIFSGISGYGIADVTYRIEDTGVISLSLNLYKGRYTTGEATLLIAIVDRINEYYAIGGRNSVSNMKECETIFNRIKQLLVEALYRPSLDTSIALGNILRLQFNDLTDNRNLVWYNHEATNGLGKIGDNFLFEGTYLNVRVNLNLLEKSPDNYTSDSVKVTITHKHNSIPIDYGVPLIDGDEIATKIMDVIFSRFLTKEDLPIRVWISELCREHAHVVLEEVSFKYGYGVAKEVSDIHDGLDIQLAPELERLLGKNKKVLDSLVEKVSNQPKTNPYLDKILNPLVNKTMDEIGKIVIEAIETVNGLYEPKEK